MKSAILLLAVFAAVFSSCSTAYKTGQTPDDVYYSPLPPKQEYVAVEKQEERKYQYTDEYYDDRYLRMKVSNRYRWNDLNDWYYYERYGFGYNYNFGSYYNPYNSWNYYYNPYCCCYGNNGYSNPKNTVYKPIVKPRAFNLGGYTNTNVSNTSATRPVRVANSGRVSNTETYNNKNKSNGRGLGNTIRTILSNNNNNSNSGNSENSTRTYKPSNSSSSSNNSSSNSNNGSSSGSSGSSGSSSSGGGVSRPTRN